MSAQDQFRPYIYRSSGWWIVTIRYQYLGDPAAEIVPCEILGHTQRRFKTLRKAHKFATRWAEGRVR